MAAYPSYFQRAGTSETWVDDVTIDRAVNGTPKGRAYFTAKKRAFTVVHLLNPTDRVALETFYNTNRLLAMTFTFMPNNTVYNVLFARAPRLSYRGAMAVVEVELVEQ